MPGHQAHPGNVPLLSAQPKLPLEPSPSSLPCCRRSSREKESHSSRSSCTKLFIQPWHSSARMCRGEATAAAHPALGANHDLPAAAWAGIGAPAPSPRPREGKQAGMAGSDASGTGAAPKARLARAAARHRGAKARSRPRCHPPWRWGTRGCHRPGTGPGGIVPLERLPPPAAPCGREPGMAGRLPPPARLLPQLPGMLLPHHLPGFAPKEGSVPLRHQRDVSMPSLPGQDGSMWHRPFAAGRNIWADVVQQHRTISKQRSHQGANRALLTPKTNVGTDPGHLLQPERCKQAPGKAAVPQNIVGPQTLLWRWRLLLAIQGQ